MLRAGVTFLVLVITALIVSAQGQAPNLAPCAADLCVTKTADTDDGVCDGDCSLREAIDGAGPGDTINLPAGTYTLTLGSELTIDKNLEVIGDGQSSTTIQATGDGSIQSRVFKIIGGEVSISQVTIKNGKPVSVGDNEDSHGGGLSVLRGTLNLFNTKITGNTAYDGGGIYVGSGATLNLDFSEVNENVAQDAAGGIQVRHGTLVANGSAITANHSGEGGGGLNVWDGSATLNTTTITGNTSVAVGGGVYSAGNQGSILIITDARISNNISGGQGGGIYSRIQFSGALLIDNSEVARNTLTGTFSNGGGIYHQGGQATITNSTISGNAARRNGGGGLSLQNAASTLVNSTISGNAATSLDSDVDVGGGGIFVGPGTLTIVNGTITDNSVVSIGGGIYNSEGTVQLTNTIISDNVSGGDCAGTIASLGHNLDRDGTCGLVDPTDLPSVDPKLGGLQNNGGPTETHALSPISPAIDHIPPTDCIDETGSLLTTDQRGVSRPQGANCDIGAYELEPNSQAVGGATSFLTDGSGSSTGNLALIASGIATIVAMATIGGWCVRRKWLGRGPG